MSRQLKKRDQPVRRANPEVARRRSVDAVPDGSNAIRISFDEDEPAALIFDSQARPGALVSWAWSQLSALDGLMRSMLVHPSEEDDDAVIARAVHTVLVPVINSLEFAERRAHELQVAGCVFRLIVTTDFGIVTSHFGHRDRAHVSAHRDQPFRYRDRPFRRS